jgi:hypothetical protein
MTHRHAGALPGIKIKGGYGNSFDHLIQEYKMHTPVEVLLYIVNIAFNRRDNNPLNLPFPQHLQIFALPLSGAQGIKEQQIVPAAPDRRFNAQYGLGIKKVGDIGNNNPDIPDIITAKIFCGAVGNIIEQLGGLLDPFPQFSVYRIIHIIHDPGYGSHRRICPFSHIPNGHAFVIHVHSPKKPIMKFVKKYSLQRSLFLLFPILIMDIFSQDLPFYSFFYYY